MKLIKNGRVIDPKSQFDALADILIDGQKIVAIGQDLTREDAEIIDATGKIVAPGLIFMSIFGNLVRHIRKTFIQAVLLLRVVDLRLSS
jgi:dihydroorotase-like cyclic amidohydrolase